MSILSYIVKRSFIFIHPGFQMLMMKVNQSALTLDINAVWIHMAGDARIKVDAYSDDASQSEH